MDADHVRLGQIAGKLAAALARPVPPTAFAAFLDSASEIPDDNDLDEQAS